MEVLGNSRSDEWEFVASPAAESAEIMLKNARESSRTENAVELAAQARALRRCAQSGQREREYYTKVYAVGVRRAATSDRLNGRNEADVDSVLRTTQLVIRRHVEV